MYSLLLILANPISHYTAELLGLAKASLITLCTMPLFYVYCSFHCSNFTLVKASKLGLLSILEGISKTVLFAVFYPPPFKKT